MEHVTCYKAVNTGNQIRACALLRAIHQRKPSPAAVPVGNDAQRPLLRLVDKQNHHLAVAMLRAMLRALAGILVMAGRLQVKCAHNVHSALPQPLDEPIHGLAAGLWYLKEGRIAVHPGSQEIIG